jgi:PTH1 family peptidyl-tRNA hydrolase
MENLYLIVGLGNPGADYARTRHNAGFLAVERLARRWQADWSLDDRFKSRLAKVEREGRRLMLCQPQTFMNLSGEAVGKLADYFQVSPKRLLVIVDDADLPLGEIRLRSQGSSGGHHGLESVEQCLATRRYPRLRIGIGRTTESARAITGHVLGRFSAAERNLLDRILKRAADSVECWLSHGIEKAMNQFNGTVDGSDNKDKATE